MSHAKFIVGFSILTLLSACETRVVKYDPFLSGLPGSESQTEVVRAFDHADPRRGGGAKLRTEAPDGTVTLSAKSGLHMMVNLYNTLLDDDKQLFVDQVLSERVRGEYIARGEDPGEIFEHLIRNWDDFETLCLLLPGGEFTPGTYLRNIGSRVQRFEAGGTASRSLRFRGFDMIMERGSYRLVRVVESAPPAKKMSETQPQTPGATAPSLR